MFESSITDNYRKLNKQQAQPLNSYPDENFKKNPVLNAQQSNGNQTRLYEGKSPQRPAAFHHYAYLQVLIAVGLTAGPEGLPGQPGITAYAGPRRLPATRPDLPPQ
jgi:hypothetical protein